MLTACPKQITHYTISGVPANITDTPDLCFPDKKISVWDRDDAVREAEPVCGDEPVQLPYVREEEEELPHAPEERDVPPQEPGQLPRVRVLPLQERQEQPQERAALPREQQAVPQRGLREEALLQEHLH